MEELEIVIQAKLDESVKNISKRLKTEFAKIQQGLNFKGADNPLSKMKVSMEKSANAILKDQARLQAQIQVINAKAQQQIETNLVRETAKRVKAQEVLDKAARAEQQRLEAANQAAAQAVQQQKQLDEVVKRAVQRYNDQFKLNTDAVQKMYDTQRSEILKTSKLAVEQNNVIPSAMRTFQAYDNDYQISAKEAAATLQAIDNEVKRLVSDTKEVPSALKSVMDYFGDGISLHDLKENLSQVDEVLRTSFLSGDITEEGFAKSVRGVTENLGRMGGAAKQAAGQASDSVKNIPLGELNQKLQQFQQSAASISDNLNSRIELLKQKISGLMGEYQKAASSSGIGSTEAKELESKILSAQASLQRLTAQAEKINQPLKNVKTNTDKAKKAAKEYGDQVAKSTKSAASGFAGLGKIIKKSAVAFGAFLLAKKLMDKTVEFVKEGIKSAINAPEIENLFRVSLGAMADEAAAFADQMKKSLGVDQYNAKQMLGTFQNLTTSMGIGTQTAYKMSKSLTILANDMASFYNVSADQTFENLQSALTGESEAVRKYGYVLNETAIKQTALQYGLISAGQEMTEQQKVLARYLTLLRQSTNAQGDMANTIYSLQNQLRILQGNIAGAGRSIGDAFLPFVQAVIPWLNALFIVLQRVGAALASFTYGLFGKNYGAEQKKQQQVITNLGGVADAQTAVGDAAQGAGKKVKEALAAFDQLNIIQQESAGGGGGAGAGGGGGGALDFDVPELNIPDIESPFEKMANTIIGKVKDIKNELMNLGLRDVLNNFNTFFQDIYNQIKGYDFGAAFKNAFLNGFELAMSAINLGQKLVFPIAVALDIPGIVYEAINTISTLFQTLNGIVESVTPGLEQFVKIGLVPIAEWVGGKIKDAFKFLQEILGRIGAWFSEHKDMFTAFGTALGNFVSALWEGLQPIFNFAWDVLTGAISTLIEILLKAAEIVIPALTSVLDFLADHMDALLPIIIGIGAAFATWKVIQTVTSIIKKVGEATQAFSTIQTAFGLQMAVSTKAVTLQQVALGVLTGKLKLATVAQAAWKTVMSAIKSPMTWLITGVAALTAGIVALIMHEDEETKRHKEAMKAIKEQTKAREELIAEQKKQLDGNLAEIDNTKRLADELKTIVDENGKIKEGYEKRAAYIVNELKEATDVEIEIIDGVVKGYQGLTGEIKTNITKNQELKEELDKLVDSNGKIKEGEEDRAKVLVEQLNKYADENLTITGDTIEGYETLSGKIDTQIQKEKALADELKKLVDENGYVDDANKDRVSVILNELSPAMQGEYELIGNQIKGYQGLRDEIDKTIEKKRTAAILESKEEAYKNAIKNQTEAIDKQRIASEKANEVLNQINETKTQLASNATAAMAGELQNLEKQYNQLIDEAQGWAELSQGYNQDILDYQYANQLAAENTTESIIKLNQMQSASYMQEGKNIKISLEDQIKNQKIHLSNLNEEYDKATGERKEILKSQISAGENYLKSLDQQLAEERGAISGNNEKILQNQNTFLQNRITLLQQDYQKQKQLLDDLQAKYKTGDASITQQMIEEQKKRVQESEKSLNQMITVTETKSPEYQAAYAVLSAMGMQGLVDGMEQNKSKVETEVEKVTGSIKSTFEKLDMTSIGKNIMSGIAKGVTSGKGVVASAIGSAMSNMLVAAKKQWEIKSPSKVARDELGKNIVMGIVKGINQTVGVAASAMKNAGESIKTAAENYLLDDYEIGLKMYGIELPETAKGAVLPIPTADWQNKMMEFAYLEELRGEMSYNNAAIESNREIVIVLNQLANRIIQEIRDSRVEVNIGDDQIYASAKKGGAKYSKITGQPAF